MKTKFNSFLSISKVLIVSVIIGLGQMACSDADDPVDEMKKQENPDDMKGNNSGDAPDFSLTSLSGTTVSLQDFDNKVLVMFFLGNSCPACKTAAPKIQTQIADAYASNSNVAIIGLDQWNGTKASVQGFKNTTGITFPLLLNASKVASDYNTTYDRLVVVNKDGDIVFKGTQGASKDIAAALSIIDDSL
ncbi:peroxiredoxin family protein [Carboxylicivirga marina]|uniref:peroxiredoxin family protein n=1 Tax=Carboxylicivirga marina TaxID=2800988 RepID=UPI0025933841|nr:TlpA disulfide reductase family protein [uncultured Carboxylicivirga sp.]